MKSDKEVVERLKQKDFAKANQIVHPVEKEWHYPILTKYGWLPKTLTGKGFVRTYDYINSKMPGEIIKMTTGVNADYWSGAGGGGYWFALEPHLKKILTLS